MFVTSRRLLSYSGIALGPFLFLHLAINARALRGDYAFASTVDTLHRIPRLALLEWFFILAPLLVHTTVGLWLVFSGKRLAEPSPYPESLRAAVRATGVAAVGFIALHLFELRFRTLDARTQGGELATLLAAGLSSTWHGVPLRGAAYLAGTACVAFHFAAGTWAYFANTRIGQEPRARRWAGWGAGTMGAALWVLLANVVVLHATGESLFGGSAGVDDERAPLPCPADGASEP